MSIYLISIQPSHQQHTHQTATERLGLLAVEKRKEK